MRSFNDNGRYTVTHGWPEGQIEIVLARFQVAAPSTEQQSHLDGSFSALDPAHD